MYTIAERGVPMVTEAKKKANRKYDAEHMTVLGCKVQKTYANEVKAKAKEKGTTVNAILLKAIKSFMSEQ